MALVLLSLLLSPHPLPKVLNHQSPFKSQTITSLHSWCGECPWPRSQMALWGILSSLIARSTDFCSHTFFSPTYLRATWCHPQGHGGVQGQGERLLTRGVEEGVTDQGATGQDRHWGRMWVSRILKTHPFSLISLFLPLFLPLFWPNFHRSLPCLRVVLCRQ